MSFRIWGLLLELRSMNTWVHPSRGLVDSWQCAIILVFENSARFGTSGLVFVIVLSVVDNCWRILFLAKDLSMIKQSTNTEIGDPDVPEVFALLQRPRLFLQNWPSRDKFCLDWHLSWKFYDTSRGCGWIFFESLTDYKSETQWILRYYRLYFYL